MNAPISIPGSDGTGSVDVIAIAERYKHKGMSWTSAGVLAVALCAAKRKKNAHSPTIQCP